MKIIYQIRNLVTGSVYIGSTTNQTKRWSRHRTGLQKGIHDNCHLQAAWNKYGADAFEFSILEKVAAEQDLIAREQHWIDVLRAAEKPNYNLLAIVGRRVGYKTSEATKEKLRVAMFGNKHALGFKHGPEARARMAAGKVGTKRTPEQRARMAAAQSLNEKAKTAKCGFVVTAETRARLSAANMGNKSALGVKRTPEQIRRLTEARLAAFARRREESVA